MRSTITAHASARMQQRAIPAGIIGLLQDHGATKRAKGADFFFFDSASRRRLQLELDKQAVRDVGRFLNTYAVISDDGALITVGWRTKRIRNI